MSVKCRLFCQAALVAAVSTSAHGQDATQPGGDRADSPATAAPAAAPAPAEDTIVVTGVRRALASAEGIKRNSVQVIDSVVAQDIGKLPDLAVSDSAARIPGVQVYRTGGEASTVLVRGLPNFTTTYNGREISTAEARLVALQDFPSAGIAALEVFKTSTADLVEPGLAGLVNVRSRLPFDFPGVEIDGQAWALHTVQAKSYTPNFTLLATKRFDTSIGEMGFLINGSYTEMRYLDAEPSNTDFIANPTINGQQMRFPDVQRLFYRSGDRKRPSVNAAAQWRPTPNLELYAEVLWQGFRNEVDDRLLEAPLYNGQSYSNLTFRPGTNLVTGGTVVGQPNSIFTFQGGTLNRTDTFQYAGGFHYKNGGLKIDADVARTTSTFKGSTESLDRRFVGTPTITFNNAAPSFNITGLNPYNPTGFLFQGLYEQNQRSAGRDWQARIDATYEFDSPIVKSIQLGGRYTDRNATRQFDQRYAFLLGKNINASTLPLNFAVFQGVGIQPLYNFSSPIYNSIRSNVVNLRQFVIDNGGGNYTTTPIPAALQYTAKERTYAGYGQVNLAVGDRVDGTVGFRLVRTEVRVDGVGLVERDAPVGTKEITDLLPNASLRFHFNREVQFRLSAAQTRTLPNFGDLNPAISLGPPPATIVPNPADPFVNARRGPRGNPALNPFTSTNYDASLEYYFSRSGFASAAVFYRDLNGFILSRDVRVIDPALGPLVISTPFNSGRGHITGVEIQGQTFLDISSLPAWVRGFGVQGNVTFLDAKTQQPFGGVQVFDPITGENIGVSKWNYNIVGLYEYEKLSARLTYNGRSSYSALIDPRGNDLYLATGAPPGRLDLSLSFDPIKAATIFFDWTNITKDPFREGFTSGRDGAPRASYVRYLRYDESTLSLGVRFRY